MTPIDQIRKALEALRRARGTNSFDVLDDASSEFWRAASIPAIAALLASHDALKAERDGAVAENTRLVHLVDAAVQRAAELEVRMSAWELQHAAAIEATARTAAREMQERCARVCEGRIGGAVISNEW